MFTGLVEAVGELVERTATSGGCRVVITTPLAPALSEGDSLAASLRFAVKHGDFFNVS